MRRLGRDVNHIAGREFLPCSALDGGRAHLSGCGRFPVLQLSTYDERRITGFDNEDISLTLVVLRLAAAFAMRSQDIVIAEIRQSFGGDLLLVDFWRQGFGQAL